MNCDHLVLFAMLLAAGCGDDDGESVDASSDAGDGSRPDGASPDGSMDGASPDGAQPDGGIQADGSSSDGASPDGALPDSASSDGGPAVEVPVGHCGARRGAYFPSSTWVYTDVSSAPLRANSEETTTWLEDAGGWGNSDRFQIDFSFSILEAEASSPRVTRTDDDPVEYSADCDPSVSIPLPVGGRIEGMSNYVCPDREMGDYNGDCHMIVVDFANQRLFESFRASFFEGDYYSECDVAWDMGLDVWGSPPAPGSTLPAVSARNWGIGRDCTGPDAAGFPIAPLLFTVGDVQSGKVEHAIRFALPNDRMQFSPSEGDDNGPSYVWPATHAGGPSARDPDAPLYGSRWRLKADFDPEDRGLDPENPVVIAVVYGLQHYGMLLADGGEIALMAEDATGCDTSWDDLLGDDGSRVLDGIRPSDFEIVDTGGAEHGYDCERNVGR